MGTPNQKAAAVPAASGDDDFDVTSNRDVDVSDDSMYAAPVDRALVDQKDIDKLRAQWNAQRKSPNPKAREAAVRVDPEVKRLASFARSMGLKTCVICHASRVPESGACSAKPEHPNDGPYKKREQLATHDSVDE